ncbi:MBL fold metallo-hydrolase [Alteribacter aurantiacus]|uniref:MBL fold metallo-hydrolase n=1 Tax=Alteribacter aurantiacus TaxID=254410 RepID=UPI00040ABAC1|nr:MBL fold metallo-hydrolase [Alteribacter aurantiacus]
MKDQIRYGDDYRFIPAFSFKSGELLEVTTDVSCYVDQIVNVVLIEANDQLVIVDTGMPKSSEKLISLIESRHNKGIKLAAILLTHGHFDHVGTVVDIVDKWNVPVFAHETELPYLTGKLDYPEPDSSVEGGFVAKISRFFPNEAINLGEKVEALPTTGQVPFLDEFTWVHTPGHTLGHVSYFRKRDGLLLAGDAFVTLRQDSLYQVVTQKGEVSGPPRYFTTDWDSSYDSVKRLANLKPSIAITGHGPPIKETELTEGLRHLVDHYQDVAVPDNGRYSH